MVNRFVNNDQITFMGGANNTNNMGFSDLAQQCSPVWEAVEADEEVSERVAVSPLPETQV